jgi:hypothetical protein
VAAELEDFHLAAPEGAVRAAFHDDLGPDVPGVAMVRHGDRMFEAGKSQNHMILLRDEIAAPAVRGRNYPPWLATKNEPQSSRGTLRLWFGLIRATYWSTTTLVTVRLVSGPL